MNEEAILIPQGKAVIIGGRQYSIGKLTLKQTIQLSRLIASTILTSKEKIKELKDQTGSSDSNIQDFLVLVSLLDEMDVIRFFAIILNEQEPTALQDKLDLETTTEIAVALFEQNDILRIKKNFIQMGKLMANEKQEAKET